MRVETVTIATCDSCGYRQGLEAGATSPVSCRACGDGAPKAWTSISGDKVAKEWRDYYQSPALETIAESVTRDTR